MSRSPEDQIKMLVTKILFDRGGRCPVVIGLADELTSKEKMRTGGSLRRRIVCQGTETPSEVVFEKLSGVDSKKQDAEFGPQAIAILATGMPPVFEEAFYESAKGLDSKEEFFADKKAKDEIFYRMAKGGPSGAGNSIKPRRNSRLARRRQHLRNVRPAIRDRHQSIRSEGKTSGSGNHGAVGAIG